MASTWAVEIVALHSRLQLLRINDFYTRMASIIDMYFWHTKHGKRYSRLLPENSHEVKLNAGKDILYIIVL